MLPPHLLRVFTIKIKSTEIEYQPHTVGVKSMSPADIELLFVILYNITALHHNTNLFSLEIK